MVEQEDTPSYLDGDNFGCRGGSNPPRTAIKLNQKPVIIYGTSRQNKLRFRPLQSGDTS